MMWAAKIAAKLVLARLPIPYAFWKSIGLFQHGSMNQDEYARKIFKLHTDRAFGGPAPEGAVLLEMGPGDSLASAVIAASYGAGQIYMMDVGDFALKDVDFYKALCRTLNNDGAGKLDLSQAKTIEDVLRSCHATYCTHGLKDWTDIPDASVDFAWSHSVLEHVRKHEIEQTFSELYRVMKPGGVSSHNIDYMDHLGGGLNNLRFSDRLWESDFFAEAGFYTNRIPAAKMHKLLLRPGFELLKEEFGRWPSLPIARSKLDKSFESYTDDELRCRTSHLLLRK